MTADPEDDEDFYKYNINMLKKKIEYSSHVTTHCIKSQSIKINKKEKRKQEFYS